MRILVVTQYFYPENFRVNILCKELAERGHHVTVLTGYPQYPQGEIYEGYGFDIPYEKIWNGVNIERVKMKPRGKNPVGLLMNMVSFVTEANKWVKNCNEKYDAVYVFEVSPVTVGLPAVKYKKKFGTPIFFNVQDLWPENVEIVLGIHNKVVIGIINRIVDKIYNASDKILCASRGFIRNIKARGVDPDKLVFWPQFCETPHVVGTTAPECYDDKYFNIVFTGNVGDAQGLDLLVDTAEKLVGEDIKWFIVGDGRTKQTLQDQVNERKLEENVQFIGRVSVEEANRYVHHADCAYLSFKDNKLFEMTIPAKLQTYLACGTPILAAAGGECAEIIRDSKCGIVSEQNSDALYEAVKQMIEISDEDKALMKENAKKCFNDNFTVDDLITQLENLMERVQ